MVQKQGGAIERDTSVDKLISLEHELGLDNAETLHKFDRKIGEVRDKLQKLIGSLKNEGKIIAGFGAPQKQQR